MNGFGFRIRHSGPPLLAASGAENVLGCPATDGSAAVFCSWSAHPQATPERDFDQARRSRTQFATVAVYAYPYIGTPQLVTSCTLKSARHPGSINACPPQTPPLNGSTETWPSGRRRSPAKGVGPEGSRGFESLRLRHTELKLLNNFPVGDFYCRSSDGFFVRLTYDAHMVSSHYYRQNVIEAGVAARDELYAKFGITAGVA